MSTVSLLQMSSLSHISKDCFPETSKVSLSQMSTVAMVTKLGRISPFGLRISSPKKWPNFGLLFSKAPFYFFTLNLQFQNMVCCKCFKGSQVVLDLQRELCIDILAFLAWQMYWPLFPQFGQIFSQSSGHLDCNICQQFQV